MFRFITLQRSHKDLEAELITRTDALIEAVQHRRSELITTARQLRDSKVRQLNGISLSQLRDSYSGENPSRSSARLYTYITKHDSHHSFLH